MTATERELRIKRHARALTEAGREPTQALAQARREVAAADGAGVITHRLAHRDGEVIVRWNVDWHIWQLWDDVAGVWVRINTHPSRLPVVDRGVSYFATWAEPEEAR